MNDQYLKYYLKLLLDEFWYAPQDALIRAYETYLWRDILFKKPVLDIGCGNGKIDSYLFKNRLIDVGLDLSEKEVKIAKTNKLYKKVIRANAENMPFPNCYFNTVIMNSTFEHIKNDIKTVKEISRVLKRNGILYFTTTSNYMDLEINNILKNTLKIKYFNNRLEHFHYRSFEEWKNILAKNSFNIINNNYYISSKLMEKWTKIFNLFTYKYKDREIWSYLKDSRYSKYIPNRYISRLEYLLISNILEFNSNKSGMYQFISAKKI